MPRVRSLRVRIVISAATAVAALLVALGVLGTTILRHERQGVLAERLRVADLLAARLDARLAADVGRLHMLVETGVLPVGVSEKGPDPELADRLSRHFEVLNGGVLLLNPQGRPVWSHPAALAANAAPLVGSEMMRAALQPGSESTSGLLRLADGAPVVAYILAPSNGTPDTGILVALANLYTSNLESLLTEALPPASSAHAVLVDESGSVIASTDPAILFTRREHPETLVELLRAQRSEVRVTANGDSEPHVIAAAPQRRAPWIVSLGQSEAEAMAPVAQLRWALVIFGLAATAIAGFYAWWDTGAVTRPLAQLTAAAGTIAAGNLDVPVAVGRQDEIGVLALAFATMQSRLKESMDALERALTDARLRQQEADALYRVSREILSSLDLRIILQTVVDQARTLTGADVSILCLEQTGGAQIAAASDPMGRLNALVGGGAIVHPALPCSRCPFPGAAGLGEHRSVPLTVGHKTIGTLCIAGPGLPVVETGPGLLEGLAYQAAIAIENARLYEHTRALAVFEERDRIAREFHDSVAQTLGYIYTRARLLQERHPRDQDAALWADLDDMARIASATYDEVRWAIFGLRTDRTRSSGILSSIAGYLRDFTARTGVAGELTGEALGRLDLDSRSEAHVLRIIQEAVANAGKHARATRVEVRAEPAEGGLTITVADNGCGFNVDAERNSPDRSFGIDTMRERAAEIGGQLTIISHPGEGTTVQVWVPRKVEGRGHVGTDPGADRG